MTVKERLDLKQKLSKKKKDWLIDCLLEICDKHRASKDLLESKMMADEENDNDFKEVFKRLIDAAADEIERHGPGTWKSDVPSDGFDNVADALAIALTPTASDRKISDVMELTEYALVQLDKVFELQFECELDYLVDAFRHLHLEACYRVKQDRNALALRLAQLDSETEWGFFEGPPAEYSDILGKTGFSTFHAKRKTLK